MAETSILSNMYQQGGDQISYSEEEKEYTQTWKGPWSEIMKVYTTTPVVCGTTLQIGGNFTPGEKWKTSYPLDAAYNWRVKSFSVQEEQAGDHGLLRITLTPRTKTKNYDEVERWNLTWGMFQPNALAFCTNGSTSADTNAVNITHAVNYYRNHNLSTSLSAWEENGKTYYLNEAELSIAKFYANDIQPQYSYPIITYSHTWSGLSGTQTPTPAIPNWSLSVNVVSSDFTLPENYALLNPGRPAFLSSAQSWKFILRDFSVEKTQTGEIYVGQQTYPKWDVTMQARWEGCVTYETVFYDADSSKRWRIGAVKNTTT